jgi:hypothetical protein
MYALMPAVMDKQELKGAVRYDWIGGKDGGYIIFNSSGIELIRVWSEGHAKKIMESKEYDPQWLVENVQRSLVQRGIMKPF